MIALTAAEIAEAVGGQPVGLEASDLDSITCTAATTDSREVGPGALFIAKPGETTDGHRFIPQALAAGAVLALAEWETRDEQGRPHPAILVPDVVLAMGALAHAIVVRLRAAGPLSVIGITGSAGKTTTKDLLAGILSIRRPSGRTAAVSRISTAANTKAPTAAAKLGTPVVEAINAAPGVDLDVTFRSGDGDTIVYSVPVLDGALHYLEEFVPES